MSPGSLYFEYVGHLAYTLGILSFLLKDMLWLRVITIASASLCIIFNYFAPSEPMWVPIYWNTALAVINVIQVGILHAERRTIVLDEREKWLYSTVFPNFTPLEFKKLMKAATWKCSTENETLIIEGQNDSDLILVMNGKCVVNLPEGPVAELLDGSFIGEMSFLTGKVASATVKAIDTVEYISWDRTKLHSLMQKSPSLQSAMRSAMSHQLTEKIVNTSRAKLKDRDGGESKALHIHPNNFST